MTSISPFAEGYRASGLLLHVTSLSSPYGIGDLGLPAFRWIDRLHDAHQKWWQVLPLARPVTDIHGINRYRRLQAPLR